VNYVTFFGNYVRVMKNNWVSFTLGECVLFKKGYNQKYLVTADKNLNIHPGKLKKFNLNDFEY